MIRRYLNENNFKRMKKDFDFLFESIKNKRYVGELDLALRNDYFNIYFKGNSLSKVEFMSDNNYKIKIHRKFFHETSATEDSRFTPVLRGDYFSIRLKPELLHPFFQKKTYRRICFKY